MENKINQEIKKDQHTTMGSELSKEYFTELKFKNHSEKFTKIEDVDNDTLRKLVCFIDALDKEN